MEVYDILMAIAFGFAAGLWVCIFSLLIAKLSQGNTVLKNGCSTIIPGVSWYVLVFCLLAFGGSSIPDFWGAQMLMTGIMIVVLSIIGVLLKDKMPIMSKTLYFIVTIVFVSITMQILWLPIRG